VPCSCRLEPRRTHLARERFAFRRCAVGVQGGGGAGCAVDASSIWFTAIPTPTPPCTQDTIRVGGEPRSDRDSHPARDAKLSWRENASLQLLSEADASGSRLRASVRWRRGWDRRRVSPPYSAGGQNLGQGPPPATTPSVCPTLARRFPARTGHRRCGTWRPTAQRLRLSASFQK
jgi:hypothetical protein